VLVVSGMSGGWGLSVPLVALSMTACVTVHDVRGPDGDLAHVIHCRASQDCYAKAEEVCQGDYQITSTVAKLNGGQTEILVTCGAAPTPPPTIIVAAGSTADPTREDSNVCGAAYAHVADFGKYWAAHSPNAKPLPELPQANDFTAACNELPGAVQRCMHSGYRAVHAKACDAVLLRLDPGQRNKVDAMFLEAPEVLPPSVAPAAG
jgi:hypothetical protein